MPNYLTGWSASSLTPAARQVVNNANMATPGASPTVQNLLNNAATANPYGTTQTDGATNSILSAIYGPDYKNLLQSKTAGDGSGNNVDSEFQKQMTNFLFEKTAAMQGSRSTAQALEWDAKKRSDTPSSGLLGISDSDRRRLNDFDRLQSTRQAMLPQQAGIAKMAAYTPNFGSPAGAPQQPQTSGWSPAGMQWNPGKQMDPATLAGSQLTGIQRPNYAQQVLDQSRTGVTRVPGRNIGGNTGVANTWQSRLMSQGGI